MQYTIRSVPEYLDTALRASAREQGKSLNEMALQALVRGAGLSEEPRRKRDLGDLAGSWLEDAVFDNALAAQDTVDESMWPVTHRNPQKQSRKRPAA